MGELARTLDAWRLSGARLRRSVYHHTPHRCVTSLSHKRSQRQRRQRSPLTGTRALPHPTARTRATRRGRSRQLHRHSPQLSIAADDECALPSVCADDPRPERGHRVRCAASPVCVGSLSLCPLLQALPTGITPILDSGTSSASVALSTALGRSGVLALTHTLRRTACRLSAQRHLSACHVADRLQQSLRDQSLI